MTELVSVDELRERDSKGDGDGGCETAGSLFIL